jgi:hypothetical protein
MDFELVKAFAAFGGFALGVVNLGLVLYKDFIRKGKLKVCVEQAAICWRGRGDYDFHINLSIHANGGDVYLRSARIRNPTPIFGPSNAKPELHLFSFVPHCNRDLLSLDAEGYKEEVKNLFKSAIPVRDLLVKNGEHRSLTTSDRFMSERLPDQWLEVPTEDWELIIEHAEDEIVVPFSFVVPRGHDRSAFVTRWKNS